MATCVGECHYNPNSKRVTSVVTDAITMVFQFSQIKFFMVCPFLGGLSGGFVEKDDCEVPPSKKRGLSTTGTENVLSDIKTEKVAGCADSAMCKR